MQRLGGPVVRGGQAQPISPIVRADGPLLFVSGQVPIIGGNIVVRRDSPCLSDRLALMDAFPASSIVGWKFNPALLAFSRFWDVSMGPACSVKTAVVGVKSTIRKDFSGEYAKKKSSWIC